MQEFDVNFKHLKGKSWLYCVWPPGGGGVFLSSHNKIHDTHTVVYCKATLTCKFFVLRVNFELSTATSNFFDVDSKTLHLYSFLGPYPASFGVMGSSFLDPCTFRGSVTSFILTGLPRHEGHGGGDLDPPTCQLENTLFRGVFNTWYLCSSGSTRHAPHAHPDKDHRHSVTVYGRLGPFWWHSWWRKQPEHFSFLAVPVKRRLIHAIRCEVSF
jgi:hypothetical protein